MHVSAARACMPVYDKAMLVAFYFIENNTHLTLEGARGSTAVPLNMIIKNILIIRNYIKPGCIALYLEFFNILHRM